MCFANIGLLWCIQKRLQHFTCNLPWCESLTNLPAVLSCTSCPSLYIGCLQTWSVAISEHSPLSLFLISSVFSPSVTSYQTLPRNMPSHRAQIVPRYPEGYRTLPRNSMMRPDSICSVAGSVYDRALRPASTSTVPAADKRRSMRDDTMWQLYEWQQRQAFSRQSLAQPTGTDTTDRFGIFLRTPFLVVPVC